MMLFVFLSEYQHIVSFTRACSSVAEWSYFSCCRVPS